MLPFLHVDVLCTVSYLVCQVKEEEKSRMYRTLQIPSLYKFLFIWFGGLFNKFYYKHQDLKVRAILFSFCFIQGWFKADNRRQTSAIWSITDWPSKSYSHWVCPRSESLLLDSTPLISMMLCQHGGKKKENKLPTTSKDCADELGAHHCSLFLKWQNKWLPMWHWEISLMWLEKESEKSFWQTWIWSDLIILCYFGCLFLNPEALYGISY